MDTYTVPVALITERDLSRWINRSLGSIRRDRLLRRGVPFVRLNRTVRYRVEDVRAYIAAHRQETEI